MQGCQLTWAFNNPMLSDFRLILTTDEAFHYTARVGSKRRCPETTPDDDAPDGATPDATEEVFAHKLALVNSGSDFFTALISRWTNGSSDSGDAAAGGGSAPDDARAQVVIPLPSRESFGTFKKLVSFLYAQKLEEGLDRCELMQLYILADEYGVASLRHACLLQLGGEPLSSWSAAEKQLLCGRLAVLVMQEASSALADGQLAAAATDLVSEVQGEFQNLEAVWQSEGQQAAFCSLPSALVLQVLRSSKLSVSCEDTVLVPALSWLRTAGKDEPLQERRQVLNAVRLLQLSPWMLSWLLFHAPEGVELLIPQEKASILQCLAFLPTDRDLVVKAAKVGTWAARRSYANHTVQLGFSVPEEQVLRTVQTYLEDGSSQSEVVHVTPDSFGMGFMWRIELGVSRSSQIASQVLLWVSAKPSLEVAGTRVDMGRAIADGPCSFKIQYHTDSVLLYNDKGFFPQELHFARSKADGLIFFPAPIFNPRLVPHWGCTLCSLQAANDLDSMQLKLNSSAKGGQLAVTATVHLLLDVDAA